MNGAATRISPSHPRSFPQRYFPKVTYPQSPDVCGTPRSISGPRSLLLCVLAVDCKGGEEHLPAAASPPPDAQLSLKGRLDPGMMDPFNVRPFTAAAGLLNSTKQHPKLQKVQPQPDCTGSSPCCTATGFTPVLLRYFAGSSPSQIARGPAPVKLHWILLLPYFTGSSPYRSTWGPALANTKDQAWLHPLVICYRSSGVTPKQDSGPRSLLLCVSISIGDESRSSYL